MKKIIFFLMIALFSYSVLATSINLTSPVMGDSYYTNISIQFSVSGKTKDCYFKIDNNNSDYNVSQKKVQFINDVGNIPTDGTNGMSALFPDGGALYTASTEGITIWNQANKENVYFRNKTSVWFQTGKSPARFQCLSGSYCALTYIDSPYIQEYHFEYYPYAIGVDYRGGTTQHYGSYDMDLRLANNYLWVTEPLMDAINLYNFDSTGISLIKQYAISGSRPHGIKGASNYYTESYFTRYNDDSVSSVHEETLVPGDTISRDANNWLDAPNDIEVDSARGLLYVLSDLNESICVYNYTSPSSFDLISCYKDSYLNYPEQMFFYDNILYIDDVENTQIISYDVSNTIPKFIEKFNATYSSNYGSFVQYLESLKDIYVADGYLYTANSHYNKATIFSVKSPSNYNTTEIPQGVHNLSLYCDLPDGSLISSNVTFIILNSDKDGDNVVDWLDNCPNNYNPGQQDSDYSSSNCADASNVSDSARYYYSSQGDNCDSGYLGSHKCFTNYYYSEWKWSEPCSDGGDACDNCVNTFNINCTDQICYQLDLDGDEVGDVCDNCPSVSNPTQADCNHNGVGDACDACPCWDGNRTINTELGIMQCLVKGTCHDGIKNWDESEIDYGGRCGTCNDGIAQCYNFTSFNFTVEGVNYTVYGCNSTTDPANFLSINDSEYPSYPDFGGRCGDCRNGIVDREELSVDYGGHCGSCEDGTDGGLYNHLGKTDIDYGGECGTCNNGTEKKDDIHWLAIPDKKFPFDSSTCKQGQAVIGGASSFMIFLMVLLVIIIIIVVGLIIWAIIVFGGGIISGAVTIYNLLKTKKKTKDLYKKDTGES